MATTPTFGVGMFGPTVADYRQQYLKNLQGQFSAAQSPYERMGIALGNIVGAAMGVKDPELERRSNIQSIYSAVAMMHPDQTTPEFYKELANTFNAAGLQEQALISAEKAKEVETANLDRRIKLATFAQTQEKSRRENVDYYKKNPEQAEFRINELAEIIKADPGNETALDEYNKIARAASEGAIEAAQKTEKETVDLQKNKAQLSKYKKDLEDATKFGPAERWDAEREAAIALLKVNNIGPTDDLPQSVRQMEKEIVEAQKLALRTPLGTSQQKTPAYNVGKPTPDEAGSPNVEAKVKASGLPYEPDKYEYRVLANGTVQRKKKQ